jgi:hypothetical protein
MFEAVVWNLQLSEYSMDVDLNTLISHRFWNSKPQTVGVDNCGAGRDTVHSAQADQLEGTSALPTSWRDPPCGDSDLP